MSDKNHSTDTWTSELDEKQLDAVSGGIQADNSLGVQVAPTTPSVTSGSTTVATKIKTKGV